MPVLPLPVPASATPPTPQQQLQAAVNTALSQIAAELGQPSSVAPIGLVPLILSLNRLVYACPIMSDTPGIHFGPQDVYNCLGTGAAIILQIRSQLLPVVIEFFPLFGLTAPAIQIPPTGVIETINNDGTVTVSGSPTPLQSADANLISANTALAAAQAGLIAAKAAWVSASAEYSAGTGSQSAEVAAQAQVLVASIALNGDPNATPPTTGAVEAQQMAQNAVNAILITNS